MLRYSPGQDHSRLSKLSALQCLQKCWQSQPSSRKHIFLRRFFALTFRETLSPSWASRNACLLGNAFEPTIWFPCPFGRFQWDRLRQPDKWLDAKQVRQHHGFFCQELMEGLHDRI